MVCSKCLLLPLIHQKKNEFTPHERVHFLCGFTIMVLKPECLGTNW